MQRQTFLGAAAALSEMPGSASNVAADGDSDDTNEENGDDEPDYGRNTVVNTSGRLEDDDFSERALRVATDRHRIGRQPTDDTTKP
jgi:hypothetical protein